MNRLQRIVIAFLTILIFGIPAFAGDKTAGGACEYDNFIGKCRVKDIYKSKDSIAQGNFLGGAGYQGYEVKFDFSSPEIVTDPAAGISYGQQRALELGISLKGPHILKLANSWYPGPEFLKKYRITEDAVFDCTINLIKSGSCSPVDFVFDAIDTTDYFEGKEGK